MSFSTFVCFTMLTPTDILWGVAAPAGLSAGAVLLASLGRWKTGDARPWGPALGIAGGFALASIALFKLPPFPPVAAQGWLVWLAIPIIVVAIVASLLKRFRWITLILSLAVVALTAWLLLRRNHPEMVVPIAGAMIVWFLAMELLAWKTPGVTFPLLLAIWAGATGLVLINSATLTIGQLALAVTGSLGGVFAVALLRRHLSLTGGGILSIAVLVPGLLLFSHYFAELTQRDAILLAIAPLMLWLGELPVIHRLTKIRLALRVLPFLIVLSIPLLPALKGLHKTYTEQSESTLY